MKKTSLKIISLFFAMLLTFSSFMLVGASAGLAGETEKIPENLPAEELKPEISVTAENMQIIIGKKTQLTAELINCPEGTEVRWESSDKNVAFVDQKGLVRGRSAGRAVITAKASVNEKEITGAYVIHVVKRSNFVYDLLVSKQVLSYKYSYVDDYYYTNDKKCWQSNFGFNKLYDIVAPYVLMEYDYVRVHFTYEQKDWMVQLWKGQYGLLFYGCEMGIYNKPHSDKRDKLLTTYACAPQSDWQKMEMSLYHDKLLNGNYVREFTRDYDDYWWCTGFKDGHLLVEEPASELRMVSRITFKNEEMTSLFVNGLEECGFSRLEGKSTDDIDIDQFCVDGNDVYFKWQNISNAENTMPIKIAAGTLFFLNILAVIMLVFGLFGMAGFFIFVL